MASRKGWGVVVLAAGASSRMGTPKQLLQWQNQSLLRRAAQIALDWAGGEKNDAFGVVCVVLGANAEACQAEVATLPVLTVVNADWKSGMAGSLRVGVQAVLQAAPGTSGLLVMLCDTPRVGPESLVRLWDAHEKAGFLVTASTYENTFGVPALFDRAAFPDLVNLSGTEGAKSVIGRFLKADQGGLFLLPEAAEDLDTPGDYARLTGHKVQ